MINSVYTSTYDNQLTWRPLTQHQCSTSWVQPQHPSTSEATFPSQHVSKEFNWIVIEVKDEFMSTYLSVFVVMSAAVIPWYTSVSFHTGFKVFFNVFVRSLFAWGDKRESMKISHWKWVPEIRGLKIMWAWMCVPLKGVKEVVGKHNFPLSLGKSCTSAVDFLKDSHLALSPPDHLSSLKWPAKDPKTCTASKTQHSSQLGHTTIPHEKLMPPGEEIPMSS